MNYKLSQCHNIFLLQKGISPSPVSFWSGGVLLLLLNRSLRDLVSLRGSFIDKPRGTLIVASSFGDREKRRFEVLQKGISPSPVSFWSGGRPRLTSRLVLK
ncbi:BnaC04g05570D [Brassica napus]|uniref:BnaC04g05570D protein n=1 Tax=Brassica napus TaxID=3708 RepID=A0A078G6B9_BRANA|nr:BnaC04g05570D [Brassica napus]